ncbi:MAG: DUF2147 domain-containing protein [Sphingomicrobium sp.]
MKLAALTLLLVTSPAVASSSIEGSWSNPQGSVTVRIAPCGGSLCGRVTSASAKAREDASAGGTPNLIGAELMSGLEPTGPGSWHGTIFVPDVNRRAEADLHLLGPRTLEIEGCALGGLLCKSQTWNRVAAPVRPKRRRR